jgi:hypothetical protein
MNNKFKTNDGWKTGESLSFQEVFGLDNANLYRWCISHSPYESNFDMIQRTLISVRFELFVLMIQSHTNN